MLTDSQALKLAGFMATNGTQIDELVASEQGTAIRYTWTVRGEARYAAIRSIAEFVHWASIRSLDIAGALA